MYSVLCGYRICSSGGESKTLHYCIICIICRQSVITIRIVHIFRQQPRGRDLEMLTVADGGGGGGGGGAGPC